MKSTARTTISIPQGLKKGMTAVTESVNWSAVAADAFKLKLGEIAERNKMEDQDMSAVVDRLRASKIKRASSLEVEGREIGKRWAERRAEFDQLERLAASDYAEYLSPYYGGPDNSPAYNLALAVCGDRDEVKEFWDGIGLLHDARLNKHEFVNGFAEAAIAVYEQVRDKI